MGGAGARLLAQPCSGMTLGSPLAGQRSSLVHGALGEEPGGARSPVFFLSGSHGRGLFTGIPGSRHSLPFSPHGRCLRQSPGARRARPGHEVSAVGLPRAPPAAPSPLPPEDRGLGDVSITSAPSSRRTTAPSCPTRGRKTSTRTASGTPVTTMTTTTASRTRRWAAPVPRALLALRSPPWSAQGLPRTGSAHGGGRSAQERPVPFPPPPPTPLPPRAQGLPCTGSTRGGAQHSGAPGAVRAPERLGWEAALPWERSLCSAGTPLPSEAESHRENAVASPAR